MANQPYVLCFHICQQKGVSMNTTDIFKNVIGYEAITNELLQVCDMVHNREVYEKLGAKVPKGILLYGVPGVGKTLLAKSFIKGCEMNHYTIRKTKGGENFINEIHETFEKARANTPSIVFLDDMDKFSNEEETRRDTDEYVTVQSEIDASKDLAVLVIATVNEYSKLPESLVRAGRFDRTIEVTFPKDEDVKLIIQHYFKDKPVSESINYDDISKMMGYNSCAELEAVINEAAIEAAYERCDAIEMDHIVNAVIKTVYDGDYRISHKDSEKKEIALHEAGHAVVSEIIQPGSVGLISIKPAFAGSSGGFVHARIDGFSEEQKAMNCLGGKAAVEMCNPNPVAKGCGKDVESAWKIIWNYVVHDSACGFSNFSPFGYTYHMTDAKEARVELVVTAMLENVMRQTQEILNNNKSFLDALFKELYEKEILLHSDIQRIRKSCMESELLVA